MINHVKGEKLTVEMKETRLSIRNEHEIKAELARRRGFGRTLFRGILSSTLIDSHSPEKENETKLQSSAFLTFLMRGMKQSTFSTSDYTNRAVLLNLKLSWEDPGTALSRASSKIRTVRRDQ